MRLIDSDRLLTDKMKSKYYHLQNGDIAIPIIDIEHSPTVEAIPKADYENRLKADLAAILEEIDLQFDEICFYKKGEWKTVPEIKAEYKAIIQQKINELEGKQDPTPQI